jgi:hypothetical protein
VTKLSRVPRGVKLAMKPRTARRRTEEKRSGGVLPLRAPTTTAGSTRSAPERSGGNQNCRDMTIRRPKIYAVPIQPFF